MTEKNLNTYLCKVCNKERAKDSNICPHCGTEEAHWTKILERWVWVLVVAGLWIYLGLTEVVQNLIYLILH